MSKLARILGGLTLGLLVGLSSASPVLAASRSQTFDVSCVVKPVFQISSPSPKTAFQGAAANDPAAGFQPAKRKELGVSGSGSGIAVQSNLIHTLVNTEVRKQAGTNVKIYSVTVL